MNTLKVDMKDQLVWEVTENLCTTRGEYRVALSRLTSLDGLYLSRPLRPSDIRVDPDVQRFMAGVRAAAS